MHLERGHLQPGDQRGQDDLFLEAGSQEGEHLYPKVTKGKTEANTVVSTSLGWLVTAQNLG
jgi:hypothetical protein